MPAAPDPRPAMETIHASGLLAKYGFNDGSMPDSVLDVWLDRHAKSFSQSKSEWGEDILVPIARDLLVPALPMPVVFEAVSTRHNPARVSEIDGRPYDAETVEAEDPVYWDTFHAVHVSIPLAYLADVLDGSRSFAGLDRLTGLNLDLLTDAFAIDMTVDEIAAAHAAGTLTHDALDVMGALRA